MLRNSKVASGVGVAPNRMAMRSNLIKKKRKRRKNHERVKSKTDIYK